MHDNRSSLDFDRLISRKGTGSRKWDDIHLVFGSQTVLPLWIADMDFAVPDAVVEKIKERARHPIYAYNGQEATFNQAVVSWVKKRHNWNIEPEWILQAPGVVPSIILTLLALSEPGDGVIIQPPVYPPFFASIKDNERVIVENPLLANDGRYEMDFDDLEQKLADPKNKLLLLCNPHNPVGRVWSKEELTKVYELCQRYEVDVLSDEVHSDLVYGAARHTVFASLGNLAGKRNVTFMAASKTFNLAGLNTSYMIVPCERRRGLIKRELSRMHLGRSNLFGVLATEAAYGHGEVWLESLLAYLEKNAATLVDFVTHRLPGVKVVKPEGTFLAWIDFRSYFPDANELRNFLIHSANVGLNPGESFGTQGIGFARLNFATQTSVLLEALQKIEAAIRPLKR